MKLLFFCIISCSFLFAQNWQFDQTPTRQNLARLDMLSDSLGWAVSYDGLILKYNGKKWSISDSLNQFNYQKIIFEDSLLVSPDNIGDIYTIRVPDDQNGWLAVNNVSQRFYLLVYFNLVNQQYSAQNFPIKIRAFDFWNSGLGIAVGEGSGYLYENGKWAPLKLPVSVDFRNVKFIKKNKIFICGQKGILLRGDGINWVSIETNVSRLFRDLDFISEDEGWIVGNGVILHYKNGEIKKEVVEPTYNLWAIDMLSSNFGFAVGEGGIFLQYNGKSWDTVQLNTDIDFHDIEMLNDSTGFVVGSHGSILNYTQNSIALSSGHQFLFSDQVHLGSENLMDRISDVHGVTVADFNNNLLPDVYLTCYQSLNHLLINQGGGYYQDFVIESGTGGNVETRIGKKKYEFGSLAADFDRDGDTDLLLAGKRRTTTYFLNNGKAIFKDATSISGLPENLEIIDGALGDFNEDGYPDFALADENRGLRIFLNQKYNHFIEPDIDSLKLPHTGIRAVKIADVNGDHHQDILAVYQQASPIFLLNSGNGSSWQLRKKMFQGALPDFINSITFADFNTDGFTDIYFCSEDGNDGIFIFNKDSSVFQNKSDSWNVKKSGRSYTAIAGDFNLDSFTDLYVSRYGHDYLYLNNNNLYFNEFGTDLVYSKSGYLSGFNTGGAFTDIDNNGTPDLIVGNADFWSSILQNMNTGKTFLNINLIGVEDTKEALGAKIWLWPVDEDQNYTNLLAFKEISPSNGLFSQNSQQSIFGLGSETQVDVKIRFLNGDERIINNIQMGTELTVYQSTWFNRQMYAADRALLQFLHIPDMIWLIIKFLLFIVFILGSVRFIENRYQWRPAHAVLYVLILISIYLFQTLFMSNTGILYHILPFGMIVFTLLVLVVINEQIRKTSSRHQQVQEKIRETSAVLTKSNDIKEIISVVIQTIQFIFSYRYISVYLYYPSGNYFLNKFADGIKLPVDMQKINLDRKSIAKLIHQKSPLPGTDLTKLLPAFQNYDSLALTFPLTKDNEIYGFIILGLSESYDQLDSQSISILHYIMLQFSNTLANIRILQKMQNQQKLLTMGTFFSGIVHNLKNPIEGLRMIIEVLYDETDPQDTKFEYIKELKEGVLKLKKDLLSSFEYIKYKEYHFTKINLSEFLTRIVQKFEKLNYPKLEIQFANGTAYIEGDEEQLGYALENIIENAAEASGFSRPVKIDLKMKEDEEVAQIDIKDYGKGIPVDELDKMFDIFYSTRGSGRGLGLAITSIIIERHGGYINVNSNENDGTLFTVVLPYSQNRIKNE